jgi:magnesium chelatase subunit D
VSPEASTPKPAWAEAVLAAVLAAIDPAGLGGICVRAQAGPVRDRWLAVLRGLLPTGSPLRRVPLHVADDRLLGGLDLAATLQAGRPVAQRGLLAEADGGFVLLTMAERVSAGTAARIAAVLDWHEVSTARDGVAMSDATRVGVIALDEGIEEDERPPTVLLERLAMRIELGTLGVSDTDAAPYSADDIVAARQRLAGVASDDMVIEALCATAAALGVHSMRAVVLALHAARAAAALAGRSRIGREDAAIAGRLVLAPRATQLPAAPESADAEPPPPPPEPPPEDSDTPPDGMPEQPQEPVEQLPDVVLEATQAAIPAGLLALLKAGSAPRSRTSGRVGATNASMLRGRPAGVRPGRPRGGVRLNVIETLRAAAPWQRLRREVTESSSSASRRIEVRSEDFRISRYKQRSETTTIFVVDASGSSALHRLAEAKAAVELLLADCYVRRDRVAVIAFRGRGAEVLLPPTRSLVRAKRGLAGLPGGGGTPLAAAIDAAVELAEGVQRRGGTPGIVLLTDGRANIARDGTPGRPRAQAEATSAARRARLTRVAALVVDTSPRPQPLAAAIALEMDARYLPLPHADGASLTRAAKLVGNGR